MMLQLTEDKEVTETALRKEAVLFVSFSLSLSHYAGTPRPHLVSTFNTQNPAKKTSEIDTGV